LSVTMFVLMSCRYFKMKIKLTDVGHSGIP
jgi:hypothetical protein